MLSRELQVQVSRLVESQYDDELQAGVKSISFHRKRKRDRPCLLLFRSNLGRSLLGHRWLLFTLHARLQLEPLIRPNLLTETLPKPRHTTRPLFLLVLAILRRRPAHTFRRVPERVVGRIAR